MICRYASVSTDRCIQTYSFPELLSRTRILSLSLISTFMSAPQRRPASHGSSSPILPLIPRLQSRLELPQKIRYSLKPGFPRMLATLHLDTLVPNHLIISHIVQDQHCLIVALCPTRRACIVFDCDDFEALTGFRPVPCPRVCC